MYSRAIDGDQDNLRTFGVSGKLWQGVLVMFDRETDSYWTQLDGRSIKGQAAGDRLEHFASEFTTWDAWTVAHPDTLVLVKSEEEREQSASHYADYFADKDDLYFPELADGLGVLEPKDLVFGVFEGDDALTVEAELLGQARVVNAVVGGVPVALLMEPETGFVRAIDRRLRDDLGMRLVLLEPYGDESACELVRDGITGEVHAVEEFEVRRIDRAFWYAWGHSHVGSRVLAK